MQGSAYTPSTPGSHARLRVIYRRISSHKAAMRTDGQQRSDAYTSRGKQGPDSPEQTRSLAGLWLQSGGNRRRLMDQRHGHPAVGGHVRIVGKQWIGVGFAADL